MAIDRQAHHMTAAPTRSELALTADAAVIAGAAPCSTIPASAIKAMCEAWTEMNTILARDGVPYMRNGYKSDVSQEYWCDIMQRIDDEVKSATGQGCWLHPALYSPNDQAQAQPPTATESLAAGG